MNDNTIKEIDDVMEDLTKGTSESTFHDILNNLMTGGADLDLKTRIESPLDLARLWLLGYMLHHEGKRLDCEDYRFGSLIIKVFIKTLNRYSISDKGLGREEIIRALVGLWERLTNQITLQERLTTNLKSKDMAM